MKSVKQALVFFYSVFLLYALNSCDTISSKKIDLEIDLVNDDAFLSNKNLKTEENLSFPLKNVNIKFFEKIYQNVLQRAYIVEEELIDDGSSVFSSTNSENDENEYVDESDYANDADENNPDEEKVISTSESSDSFVTTERKVFKKVVNNKPTTYYYVAYTFNFDLDKMSSQNLNAVLMSLGTMPEYLYMLPEMFNGDSDSKKYFIGHSTVLNGTSATGNKMNVRENNDYPSFSAVELLDDDDKNVLQTTTTMYIMRALETIDYLINYLVISAGHIDTAKEVIEELHVEREYLYRLKDLSGGDSSVENAIWNNKANFERFFIYKALYNIKLTYSQLKSGNGPHFNSRKKKYFTEIMNLVDRSLLCGELLTKATYLDIVIVDNVLNYGTFAEQAKLELYHGNMHSCKNVLDIVLDSKHLKHSIGMPQFHEYVANINLKRNNNGNIDVPELDEYDEQRILKQENDRMAENDSKTGEIKDKIITSDANDESDRILPDAETKHNKVVDHSYLQKSNQDILIDDIINEETKDTGSLLELNKPNSIKLLVGDDEDISVVLESEDSDNADQVEEEDLEDDDNDDNVEEDSEDDDESLGFTDYLKKEALSGLNNVRLNIKDVAAKKGKKMADAAVKKGKNIIKDVIKKGKGGIKEAANKISKKTGMPLGSNKNVKKSKEHKGQKSSLRSKRGKKNGSFISLNAEAKKMLKNEDGIKEEVEEIQATYETLSEKEEELKYMLSEPTPSDKKILKEFENYEKSEEASN